jgi:hypothetical protein
LPEVLLGMQPDSMSVVSAKLINREKSSSFLEDMAGILSLVWAKLQLQFYQTNKPSAICNHLKS